MIPYTSFASSSKGNAVPCAWLIDKFDEGGLTTSSSVFTVTTIPEDDTRVFRGLVNVD